MNFVRIVAAACVLGAVLAGCGGASNAGGDTTCPEFLAKSSDDMAATVARMIKERAGSNASTSRVYGTVDRVRAACAEPNRENDKIGDLGI